MKKRILTALLAVCMVLTLVPLTAFADEGTPSESSVITTVGVCGIWIGSGNYYVSDGNFGLKRAAANTVPASGFVIYDKATAKLTINNIQLRQTAGEPCLIINNAELPAQNTYVDMTLEVVGTTALKALGEGRGLNIENVNLNIIGDGSLYVSSAKDYAVYARSLTVSSAVKFTAVANKAGVQTAAISTVGDILFKNGTVVVESQGADSTSAAILSSYGNITVEGTADVTAKGDSYGVNCSRGTFFVKGGKFSAETLNGDAVWAKNIAVSGGYGTVYGNPNVIEFTKPTDSSLGTDFDEYVTVDSKPFVYTGKMAEPKAEIKVNKIALTKTLTQGTDYNVEADNNAVNVGEHGGKIKAVESSGNVGTLDFDFDITPKKSEWDLSDINVSKAEDGTTSAAKVEGKVKLKGICGEDDVTLTYGSVKAADFPDAKAGEYSVKLSLENANITGESAGNYTLPESNITVTAQIESLITDDNKDSAESNISQLPKNGDSSHLLLEFALVVVSGGALAILAVIAFKKKTESAKQ